MMDLIIDSHSVWEDTFLQQRCLGESSTGSSYFYCSVAVVYEKPNEFISTHSEHLRQTFVLIDVRQMCQHTYICYFLC